MIKKFKVFVRGSQKELKKERLAAKEIILDNTVLRKFFDVFILEELLGRQLKDLSRGRFRKNQ